MVVRRIVDVWYVDGFFESLLLLLEVGLIAIYVVVVCRGNAS